MKILEPGNPPDPRKPIIFRCKNCGCKFEAYKDEYKFESSQREPNEDYYAVKCPCCEQWATRKWSDVHAENKHE